MSHRFLPKELSPLFAQYLVLVRPVESYLCELFDCKGKEDVKEFLCADYKRGLWDGDTLSGLLKKFTASHGMMPLGFREYRQVATAFMERHIKYNMERPFESALDHQAGHSSSTAGAHYAVSSTDHRTLSREALHRYYLVSDSWHELLLKAKKNLKQGMNLWISFNSTATAEPNIQEEENVISMVPTSTPEASIHFLNPKPTAQDTSLTLE